MIYYGFKSVAKFPRSNLKNLGFANGMSQVIKSLFANNEQGFAFDLNDLSTMYQDAAGITPVTGVGQPVGLVLDKSKGLMLSNDLTDITKQSGNVSNASITYDGEWWNIFSTASSSAFLGISQGSLNPGTYRINFSFKQRPKNSTITVDTAIGQFTLYPKDLNGNYSLIIQVTSSFSIFFRDVPVNSGNAGSFKINSIYRLYGNHATQSTSAKRPILQQNATTGAYYLAFDGVDDFLVTGNMDFSGGDKVSLFTGLRKLSDSKNYAMVCEFGQASSSFIAGSFNIQSPNIGATYASESRGTSVHVTNITTASYAAPHSAVLSAFMQTTNTNILRVNKTQFSNSNAQGGGNYSNSPLYLGMRRDATLNFNGHLYSLIGIARLATTTEITNTENVIAKNVGVTL